MRPFARFWRKLCVISLLLEIFRRLNAISIAFYIPNAMYASCIVEWSRPARKMRQFTRFWRQTQRYFAIVGDISPFKPISTAVYTAHATHAVFRVESSTTVRKVGPFPRFWRHTERYFALLEIFRRLNAISIALYMPNIMHAVFIVETSPTVRNMRSFTRFSQQTERYMHPVGDIPTFKRYFHRILHAECYARRF